MRYYIIKDSKELYSVFSNGLNNNEIVYSIDEIFDAFNLASTKCIPCILEIKSSDKIKKFTNFKLTRNIDFNDIELVDPKEFGIKNAASSFVYSIYNGNDVYISNEIKKIANDLSKCGNKDLSDYLNLVLKISFFDKNIKKTASVLDLGDPDIAGKSLADIVMFLLKKIPEDGRKKAISSMIGKIRGMNSQEIANKDMGDYSSMGQSITFIKNVLAGHKESYIRRVLDSITRNLS
jgi:hypothetical protein